MWAASRQQANKDAGQPQRKKSNTARCGNIWLLLLSWTEKAMELWQKCSSGLQRIEWLCFTAMAKPSIKPWWNNNSHHPLWEVMGPLPPRIEHAVRSPSFALLGGGWKVPHKRWTEWTFKLKSFRAQSLVNQNVFIQKPLQDVYNSL